MGNADRGYSECWSVQHEREIILICCFLFAVALYSGLSAASELKVTSPNDKDRLSSAAMGSSNPQIDEITESISLPDFVSRSESTEWVETLEYGEIVFEEFYTPLDCCLTPDDVECTWYFIVNVTGGYEPIDTWYLTISDKDGNEYDFEVWTYRQRTFDCCCQVEYTFKFNWIEDVDKICFDANNFPSLSYSEIPGIPELFKWAYHKPDCPDLGKDITFNLTTEWEGCHDPCQRFTIISTRSESISEGYLSARK
jgi:hypothetical protein